MTTRHAPRVARRWADAGASRRILAGPGRILLWSRGVLGRHLSVRWKLTLWYGIMCALTLGLLGLAMRAAFENQLSQSVDSSLKNRGETLAAVLAQNAHGPEQFDSYARRVQLVLRNNSYTASAPGQVAQVQLAGTTAQGCLVLPLAQNACSTSAPGGIQIQDPIVLAEGAHSSMYYSMTYLKEPWRVYLVPLRVPPHLRGQVFGVIEVFEAEHNFIVIQDLFTLILLLGIPLAVGIALVVGWWIARAALRPIDRISRTVRSIGESRDLSRRLRFVGPTDEVGRLAETFDGMMERIENVFETQKRFVADASHELRTPLTAIRGNADLIAIAPPEERDLCIASIRRESERMSRLVNDLLLLAAADVEEQALDFRAASLPDLLREVYRSALVLSGDKVDVILEPPEETTVMVDTDRIKQLLLNLVDNAIKFTPEGGSVGIRAERTDQSVSIHVSDTGIGISADDQANIFKRFYRVEASRSTRGSGLGLAIGAWIAEAHEGSLTVQSAPGKGSTFILRLPVSTQASPDTRRMLISHAAE